MLSLPVVSGEYSSLFATSKETIWKPPELVDSHTSLGLSLSQFPKLEEICVGTRIAVGTPG